MASRTAVSLAAVALLAPLLGCAALGLGVARALPDGRRECPGSLVPTQQIAGEFLLRQRVRVRGEGLDWQLTLVAQKRGDTLVLIGLDAFGGKQFVLTQRGSEVAIERPRGRLPLPPIDLLRDLQRARLAPAEPEAGVRLVRSGDGAVTIEHTDCGYSATFVTIDATSLPGAGAAPPPGAGG